MTDTRRKAISELLGPMRVKPGRDFSLAKDADPSFKPDHIGKERANELLAEGIELLGEYQDKLYADNRYSVLLVLQAMDAAGKDGTIKHVMSGVNPQGVSVASFKQPSTEELDHDFLWRCNARLPARGMIGIFNRSYYEEVLVVRVHPAYLDAQHLPPEAEQQPQIWKRRYHEINEWERYLTDQGTRIVKVFLNVSREEQARRFLSRIEDPAKNWKFSGSDMGERAFWDDYQKAYSEMLAHTSTDKAPWYVVPADRKWLSRLSAAAALIDALMEIDPQYPEVDPDVKKKMAGFREQLRAELPSDD